MNRVGDFECLTQQSLDYWIIGMWLFMGYCESHQLFRRSGILPGAGAGAGAGGGSGAGDGSGAVCGSGGGACG